MFEIDYTCLKSSGISKTNKITEAELLADKDVIKKAHNKVSDMTKRGELIWATLPYSMQSSIGEIKKAAIGFRRFENFVVFGMGGSARGAIALKDALLNPVHNDLPRSKRRAPRLYIEENICPQRMSELLESLDPRDTIFNVITKSGETVEVAAQFLLIKKLLEDKLGAKAKNHIVITTTIGNGLMYDIAKQEGYKVFGIPEGVGGRFSVMCAVGMLPLASVGVDVDEVLAGARDVCAMCNSPDVNKNLALRSAHAHFFHYNKGKTITVFMPYSHRMSGTNGFFCQLWAESLGKKKQEGGKTISIGQTPVPAEGVSDQHSLFQLMAEGPNDKLMIFLKVQDFCIELRTPLSVPAGLEYLAGIDLGELVNIQHHSTSVALANSGRASYTIVLPKLDARVMGQLLQYFMFQTAYAGEMFGVNTYDQPGIQSYKALTMQKLKEMKNE